MAIDTKTKRLAMINFGSGIGIHTLPEPDSSIDSDDRFHLLDTFKPAVFVPPVGQAVPGSRRRRRHRSTDSYR